jgi:hypothetical protein
VKLTSAQHRRWIDGSEVVVQGRTGLVEPTWSLSIDGSAAEQRKASGRFVLRGRLPDGTDVEACVNQTHFGPTHVMVCHDGNRFAEFEGFLL